MSEGILSMTGEQYRAADGISKSMLDAIEPEYGHPALYYAKHVAKTLVQEETPAMRLGTITHRALLEPDTLFGAFHVKPEGFDGRTKAGKEWLTAHADKPALTQSEAQGVNAMRDAVWRHPVAKRLLYGAATEQSLFANDSKGTLRKCRIDAIPRTGTFLVDLKTIRSADMDTIEKAITDHRYYVQGAYYIDAARLLGMDKDAFAFVFVESEAPHDVVCVRLDEGCEAAGRQHYERDLQTVRHCTETGKWPGRSDTLGTAGRTRWAIKKDSPQADL